jgi:hypothetical protein
MPEDRQWRYRIQSRLIVALRLRLRWAVRRCCNPVRCPLRWMENPSHKRGCLAPLRHPTLSIPHPHLPVIQGVGCQILTRVGHRCTERRGYLARVPNISIHSVERRTRRRYYNLVRALPDIAVPSALLSERPMKLRSSGVNAHRVHAAIARQTHSSYARKRSVPFALRMANRSHTERRTQQQESGMSNPEIEMRRDSAHRTLLGCFARTFHFTDTACRSLTPA